MADEEVFVYIARFYQLCEVVPKWYKLLAFVRMPEWYPLIGVHPC
jgi:hypothetical protein